MDSTFHAKDGRTFRVERETIDATCQNRADETWTRVDAAGHEHFWTFDCVRGAYRPDAKAEVPTLRWVVDGTEYWEDGEPYQVGHYECKVCGEHVTPGTCADTNRQWIAGLAHCYINDEPVSRETFEAAFRDANA